MKNPTRVYQSFIGNIENVKFNEEYLIDKLVLLSSSVFFIFTYML